MPLRFRAPGVSLRVEELLARVEPTRALRELLRGDRLRFARTRGVGGAWAPGAPIREAHAALPPGAALWLDDESGAACPVSADARETELWLPALPWPSGEVRSAHGRFSFAVLETQGERARVRFELNGAGPAELRAWAEQAGAPLIGDLAHGGSLATPEEPQFASEGALRISEAAERALARGHPWLTRDRESEDEGRFAVGAVVALVDARGVAPLGLVRVEGGPTLVARAWAPPPRRGRAAEKPASIEARVAHALARREKLRADPAARGALRLVHGEADALPGLFADRLGPVLRVLVGGRAALPLAERAIAALAGALRKELGSEPSVVLVTQLRPQPPGELLCVRHFSGPPPPEPLVVQEGPLALALDLGLSEPTRAHPGVGVFFDQRANRARLAKLVRPGGRYLNLFAHTGAFSAALLAAGAGEVVSVDLSAPYLARLEQNLRLSGLPAERNLSVRRDARRFLAELPADARFDGIVLDPPTAASAGRHFWSARQGLEALAVECLRRLPPGGFLLASSNDRRARGRLAARVQSAAAGAGVALALREAPPSEDFPSLAGFPEGAAFEAILAERQR